jgi:GntR family transcriptional regulator/MocR family aminotransferase
MNKKSTFIFLNEKNKDNPLYRQIYKAIRSSILKGELSAGTQIPATRALASELGVSRITVVNAYEQLFAEGYLESKTGSGTFVASELPEDLLQTTFGKENRTRKEISDLPLRLSNYGEKLQVEELATVSGQAKINFRPFQNGLTAIDEFPFEIWSKIASKYYKNPPRSFLGYGDAQGFEPLRTAIAAHLRSARGVKCTAEQVIITSGAQQALDLTTRIFISPNDTALIEDPCYQEVKNLFAAAGAKIISVNVDEEGFDAAKIPKTGKNAKLVYVTPSHQYPLGVTMSLARRLALIDWAKKKNVWIIEDDYNSEFRYSGRPLASLQGLDKTGRVIYIGTFSKTIFPSLRIGCIVVPLELVGIFTTAKNMTDVHSPIIEQAILGEFITDGHFARHLRRMRKLYESRQSVLVEECEKHLKNLLEVKKAEAGMHLVGWLAEGLDDKKVSEKATEENLKIMPISHYFERGSPRDGLVLGYTAFDERQIKDGVIKLSKILKKQSLFYGQIF